MKPSTVKEVFRKVDIDWHDDGLMYIYDHLSDELLAVFKAEETDD